MMKKHDEPAFPCPTKLTYPEAQLCKEVVVGHGGMTLRDYFAAKAEEGDILAQAEVLRAYSAIGLLPDGWRAKARYMHADTMLAERAK